MFHSCQDSSGNSNLQHFPVHDEHAESIYKASLSQNMGYGQNNVRVVI